MSENLSPVVRPLKNILFVALLLCGFGSLAQDRCGLHEYNKLLPRKESTESFERWMKSKIRTTARGTGSTLRTKSTLRIPVVVHVIHNGEGHPTNISDAQILSQIKVLNNDYRRTNADASSTPAEFTDRAGSADIEFVLAKRTPEGLPTNGIVRVRGPKDAWTVADNYQLKQLSYWPAEEYLNLWVCNLTDFLGFAQLPESGILPGLELASPNRLTDGVVITYDAFGSRDDGNFPLQTKYNKGRTATHEIAHFLGLRHIWGDDNNACGNSGDYVDDTPDQSGPTYNCPAHPRSTCGSPAMFQNFLDYTDDACMNIITKGQVNRITTVLENSPRRKSLTTSPALLDPEPVANDLGIRAIVSPVAGECLAQVLPTIEVMNYGNNPITSARIVLRRNGSIIQTTDFTLNLAPLAATQLAFSPLTLATGTTTISFTITLTNGVADGNPAANFVERSVLIPSSIAAPFSQPFNSLPASYTILNPDRSFTWQLADAPSSSATNKAMKINFYEYQEPRGEIDILLTPVFDLSQASAGILLFDISHALLRINGEESNDGLRVVVLKNCNANLFEGDLIYEKFGSDLATTTEANNQPFTPSTQGDWRTESISLQQYIGEPSIQLAFIGVNDYGNNLFLDNVRVFTDDFYNVSIKEVLAPFPAECDNQVTPQIVLRNAGRLVNSVEVSVNINGRTTLVPVSGLNLSTGGEQTVTLPAQNLDAGENTVTFSVVSVNGNPDADPSDNTRIKTTLTGNPLVHVPFRQNFERDFPQQWRSLSPAGNQTWEKIVIQQNTSMVYKGFNSGVAGDKAWLISPAFDLSRETAASLTFDASYARRAGFSENLDIYLSRNCGSPFELIESFSASALTLRSSSTAWEPRSEDDWKRLQVNLTSYTGEANLRIAFVVTNGRGNNLYLDNIQLYLTEVPPTDDIEGAFALSPNPGGQEETNITFNLPETEDVIVEVIDSRGRTLSRNSYTRVLNQTFPLLSTSHTNGLYIVRIITASGATYTSKFICAH